ncbi:cation:proton antiporter [Flavobacterium sp. UBA6135]|uniref:cation:proton antiporter n=1 Tax=Flavobacterium sp. UBA6135 TaxID=1946553 RepID=UPI0025C4778F|nr:cation:proton antiporter [Flavobacterium sp. UBA6135]
MIFLIGIDFNLPLKNPVLLFSLLLFIILFAPILLNKLRIPHLIGLIIAGALIGPNGFNLIARDMSIILFGTVGLQYIMFLAGLEIDLAEFKKNSGKSLVFGLLTFSIPMTIGTLAGYYILEFSLPTSVLLASMFASHTLIAYPIISKLGVAKNRAVNVTVGGTMITDTLALLVLAVIAGMQVGEINQEFWMRLGISVIVFGLVVMLIFPIIGRWFFKRFDDNISQYIFVLAMVFLGCTLAELAGIEAIIGAFLAGLALNRLIPHTSPLMNRIEFVGNALFIPFFLIGVGMLIDYKAFIKDWNTLQVAGIMTACAIVGKYIPAWITQKIFGYSRDERRLIFGLSNAQAAATLAAVLVGFNIIIGYDSVPQYDEVHLKSNKLTTEDNSQLLFQNLEKGEIPKIGSEALMQNLPADGTYKLTDKTEMVFVQGKLSDIKMPNRLLNENVLNGTILMILITCTIASFVAQKGAYNLALMEDDEESDSDGESIESDERILIPMKNIETVEELIQLAVTMKSKKNKTGLFALNIISNNIATTSQESKAKKIVDKAAVVASATDNKLNMLMRYDLNILNGISGVVKEQKISDIILGQTESLGSSESLYGPLTDGVLNKCNTTTFIYKSTQPIATIKRYLVVIPERAEREIGFPFWLLKIWNLGKNTGSKIIFYASETTLNLIKDVHSKHPVDADFNIFADWEDFLILSRNLNKDDAFVVIMSRKPNLSYNTTMQNIPGYMNKYFNKNNVILIYPLQTGIEGSTRIDLKNPGALDTFTENLERLDDVRKLIGKLFKKK